MARRASATLGYALQRVAIVGLLPEKYRVTISYRDMPHTTTSGSDAPQARRKPTDADYKRLLELRSGLRRFLRWSEEHAKASGLTPAQHQLLLAIRGHPDDRGPTVGDVAAYLLLRHHSAVGLVDRAEDAGLVVREPDTQNHSAVRLRLTDRGAEQLEALSAQHLDELAHLAPTMHALWEALEHGRDGAPHPAAPPRA
jgi:DNA-binding MarR family transcriptional regulator